MTPRRLAQLTRQLVTACADEECSGEEAAARALVDAGLRGSIDGARSALKKACSSNQPEVLKITDVAELELYCGQPIISRELVDRFDRPRGGDLLTAAIIACEETADLPRVVLEALADKRISLADLTNIIKCRDEAKGAWDAVDAAIAELERQGGATVTRIHAAE